MIGILKPRYTSRSNFYRYMNNLNDFFHDNAFPYKRTEWHFVFESSYLVWESLSESNFVQYCMRLKGKPSLEEVKDKVLEIEIEARNLTPKSIQEAMPIAEKEIIKLAYI